MRLLSALLLFAAIGISSPALALSPDGFNEREKETRLSIMRKLNPFVDQRKQAGDAPLITFGELQARLTPEQIAFLEEFKVLDPKQLAGSSRRLPQPALDTRFVRLDRQVVLKDGKPVRMDTQFLPEPAYEAYARMMAAMEQDLGKRLLVESGYRSPAYQLYLFLFYMPKHGYSVIETNRHVALPGCSEHGSPAFQAIDFITPAGINGEDRPEEFEELQEYGWLNARAKEFGFHLSYPRQGLSPQGTVPDTAFEPWHWHWEEKS